MNALPQSSDVEVKKRSSVVDRIAIDAVVERLRLELYRVYRESPEPLDAKEAVRRLFDSFEELSSARMRNSPPEQAIASLHVAAGALRFIMDQHPNYVEAWKHDRALARGRR